MPAGAFNAGKSFAVGAVDVLGSISAAGEQDVYSFVGRQGDLMNIQTMSEAIVRDGIQNPDYVDTILQVYDSHGNVIATSDDQFEPHDSSIVDLTLPANGTYYVVVSSFVHDDDPSYTTGNYELFLDRFSTFDTTDGNDTFAGGAGNDTIDGGLGTNYALEGGTVVNVPDGASYTLSTARRAARRRARTRSPTRSKSRTLR